MIGAAEGNRTPTNLPALANTVIRAVLAAPGPLNPVYTEVPTLRFETVPLKLLSK